MTLTANRDLDRYVDQELRQRKVMAAKRIYKGALVGLSVDGYAKPFEPGDVFAGVAYEEQDNTSGASGDKSVRVFVQSDFEMTLTGVSESDAGKAVFATDDDAVALIGHFDGYVGRVVHKSGTDLAVVRLDVGGKPSDRDHGGREVVFDFAKPFTATGATAGNLVTTDGARLVSALGLGVTHVEDANGAADLEFDAVAEIAQASIEVAEVFAVNKGVKLEARLHSPAIGDDAALDMSWGLIAGITANSRASIVHADATDFAGFHMNGNSANIMARSDDATTDTGEIDSTVDNVTTPGSYKEFVVIVRPAGTVELWIDGTRILSSTSFAVNTASVLGAIVNLEKTSNDTVGKLRVDRLRVTGAGN